MCLFSRKTGESSSNKQGVSKLPLVSFFYFSTSAIYLTRKFLVWFFFPHVQHAFLSLNPDLSLDSGHWSKIRVVWLNNIDPIWLSNSVANGVRECIAITSYRATDTLDLIPQVVTPMERWYPPYTGWVKINVAIAHSVQRLQSRTTLPIVFLKSFILPSIYF